MVFSRWTSNSAPAISSMPTMSVKAVGTPEWRAADLGALNGHSNAREVLQVLRTLTLGGGDLLSAKTISCASAARRT